MPTMDEVVPVYVDSDDFAHTKQILINTKGNTWKVPRMASTAAKGIVSCYINNTWTPTDYFRNKLSHRGPTRR